MLKLMVRLTEVPLCVLISQKLCKKKSLTSFSFLSTCLFISSLAFPPLFFLHTRSRQRPIYHSCLGTTLLFMLECSRRSISHIWSPPFLLQVSSPFKSWTCGSSTLTRPQLDATMSIPLQRRGPGNRPAGLAHKLPTR